MVSIGSYRTGCNYEFFLKWTGCGACFLGIPPAQLCWLYAWKQCAARELRGSPLENRVSSLEGSGYSISNDSLGNSSVSSAHEVFEKKNVPVEAEKVIAWSGKLFSCVTELRVRLVQLPRQAELLIEDLEKVCKESPDILEVLKTARKEVYANHCVIFQGRVEPLIALSGIIEGKRVSYEDEMVKKKANWISRTSQRLAFTIEMWRQDLINKGITSQVDINEKIRRNLLSNESRARELTEYLEKEMLAVSRYEICHVAITTPEKSLEMRGSSREKILRRVEVELLLQLLIETDTPVASIGVEVKTEYGNMLISVGAIEVNGVRCSLEDPETRRSLGRAESARIVEMGVKETFSSSDSVSILDRLGEQENVSRVALRYMQ